MLIYRNDVVRCMGDTDKVKSLMYDTGMTRLEAEAYVACALEGSSLTDYAKSIGKSRSLITQRVANARRKLLEVGNHED